MRPNSQKLDNIQNPSVTQPKPKTRWKNLSFWQGTPRSILPKVLVCLGTLMIALVRNVDAICGTQDWYHGWLADNAITY